MYFIHVKLHKLIMLPALEQPLRTSSDKLVSSSSRTKCFEQNLSFGVNINGLAIGEQHARAHAMTYVQACVQQGLEVGVQEPVL